MQSLPGNVGGHVDPVGVLSECSYVIETAPFSILIGDAAAEQHLAWVESQHVDLCSGNQRLQSTAISTDDFDERQRHRSQ